VRERGLALLALPEQRHEGVVEKELEAPTWYHDAESRHETTPETTKALNLLNASHRGQSAAEVVARAYAEALQVHARLDDIQRLHDA